MCGQNLNIDAIFGAELLAFFTSVEMKGQRGDEKAMVCVVLQSNADGGGVSAGTCEGSNGSILRLVVVWRNFSVPGASCAC